MNNAIYINLSNIFWVIFILTIWFHSDIVITFTKLTKLININFIEKILKIKEYHKYVVDINVLASYPDFIYAQYPNNFTKLLSCNICFPFWLTLIHTSIIWNWQIVIFIFPINYCVSLLTYLLIRKLL